MLHYSIIITKKGPERCVNYGTFRRRSAAAVAASVRFRTNRARFWDSCWSRSFSWRTGIELDTYLIEFEPFDLICINPCLPMSSMSGAIRSVTPTRSKHMISSRHAVAIIVHLARCGKSSESTTCIATIYITFYNSRAMNCKSTILLL